MSPTLELIARIQQLEQEKKVLHGNYDTLALGRASAERELDKARSTIDRIMGLVERWRSRYGTSRDACADELESAIKGEKNEV